MFGGVCWSTQHASSLMPACGTASNVLTLTHACSQTSEDSDVPDGP